VLPLLDQTPKNAAKRRKLGGRHLDGSTLVQNFHQRRNGPVRGWRFSGGLPGEGSRLVVGAPAPLSGDGGWVLRPARRLQPARRTSTARPGCLVTARSRSELGLPRRSRPVTAGVTPGPQATDHLRTEVGRVRQHAPAPINLGHPESGTDDRDKLNQNGGGRAEYVTAVGAPARGVEHLPKRAGRRDCDRRRWRCQRQKKKKKKKKCRRPRQR